MKKKTTHKKAPAALPVRQWLDENFESLILMDGYDDCIAGVAHRFGQQPIVCYDRAKVIQRHIDDGMTYEEAEEFFQFNQIGAWVGDTTPCFLQKPGE